MNIGKIIKITDEKVFIGYEDGSLKEINIENCDFEPSIGDYVELYGDIAIKVEGSIESSTVKKQNSKKSKIKPILIIALVVSVLSVSAYFIVNKVTTSQNISSLSKPSTSSSKSSSSSSSSQESSSSSTKSSISDKIPESLLTIDDKERMDTQKYSSSFSYDTWVHNEFPRYTKVRVTGEVFQINQDPDDKGILLQVILNDLSENYGKAISVFIPKDYLEKSIVEGDKITLYGQSYGVWHYKADNSLTSRPFMIAYLYERDK
ncbi:hypothetical protein [Streptococcus infantis]|uniref:hypothetical protein n=1 Tax=Streptococcus infantis TaxID=68892 RepID=UPI0039C32959